MLTPDNEAPKSTVFVCRSNKALLRSIAFFTRSIQSSDGSTHTLHKKRMRTLLVDHGILSILQLLGVPHLEVNVRAAVASLLIELVRLPANLQQVLVKAYETEDPEIQTGAEKAVAPESNLFSTEANDSHDRTDHSVNASDLLADFRVAKDMLDASQGAGSVRIKKLDGGMVLTSTAHQNLLM